MILQLLTSCLLSVLSAYTNAQVLIETVEAVVGQTAELPCNATSEKPGDKLSVLAWYRNGSRTAIYSSRDLRDDQDGSGSTENRRYQIAESSVNLLIDGLRSSDAGLYYCLADFAASPAHKTHVQLVVIEPPQRLWVVHFNGSRIASSNVGSNTSEDIGPYYVSDTVSLYCVSLGGKPQPSISWWVDGSPVKDTSTPLSDHRVRSDISIGPLKRADHGKVISCFANNNEMTPPLVIDVIVYMILPPELVSIRTTEDSSGFARVRAGEQLSLQCRVLGGRPPPAVVWRYDTGQIYNLEQNITNEPSQRLLVSEVKLTVDRERDESRVSCCAVTAIRDRDVYTCAKDLPLSVVYPPSMEITTEGEVENGTVAVLKGSCFRMNCSIRANPSIFEMTWFHEDEEISIRKGVENSPIDETLEINAVNETDAGTYFCYATNTEGSTRSEPIVVDVVYPPFCEDTSTAEYGLGENEALNLTCNMKGNPAPTVYRWVLVNEAVTVATLTDQPCTTVETEGPVLSFVRPNGTAVSTILCWGINSVEPLKNTLPSTPCTFWVTDETVPRPPSECTAVRGAGREISVTCEMGHDGGLPQKFTLTVTATDTDEQIMSITSLEPKFIVQQPTENKFLFKIVATNKKGNSKLVEISSDDVQNEAEDISQVSNTVGDITTLALGLCGGVALVALAACGLVLCAHEAPRGAAGNALTQRDTDESNCETCNSEEESEYHIKRTDSFKRAVSRHPRHVDMRRTSSFHSPRCLTEDTFRCEEPNKHLNCRVHSMQNISRKREMDALCDHLAMRLPEAEYNVPRPVNTFYTMPRKQRNRSRELSDEASEITHNSDGLSLPPPPDEFTGFRTAAMIRDLPTKITPTYSTIAKKDARKDTSRLYNNVIISPMNTVGLPTSSAASNLYSYPDDNQVNNNNPFESSSNA